MNFYFILLIFFTFSFNVNAENLPLNLLRLPAGFTIKIFADNVPDAREMTLGDKGTLFVGTRSEGKVYAITTDPITQQKKIITLAKDLHMPNGVAFRNGALYVAEVDKILRFDDIEKHLNKIPAPIVVYDKLPNNEHHGWRYIHFGPDGKLYIGIGAPCNICLSKDPRFASISRLDADGTHFEIFAHGVRNTLGMAWDDANHLWFTENSRDWLGDDLPPEEINYAPNPGLHFGFPYFYGNNVPEVEFAKFAPKISFAKPQVLLPAHVAPLGMIFYKGTQFPQKYQQQIFVALHGSWNRSSKVGYQIELITLKNNKVTHIEPFIKGWLQDQKEWGRPVDLLELPDGSLLISDDFAGVIYQVSYK